MLIALAVLLGGCNEDSALTAPSFDESKGIVEDVTPPAAPEEVQGSYLAAMQAVSLSWAVNTTDEDLAGYILYREHDGTIESLLTEPALVQFFQDGDVPPGTYRYCLRAVDLSGNESAACNTIIYAGITNPGGDERIEF